MGIRPGPRFRLSAEIPAGDISTDRRRIQVSALPLVARALSISLEELLGEAKPAARSKRGPAPEWEQQIEAISKLPRARQRFVSEMLDCLRVSCPRQVRSRSKSAR